MKKYILLMLVLLAAGFTSCSNDDISIEEKVTEKEFEAMFKINPETVIAPFTWEWELGDLQTFPENYQLRIRLLVYDNNGNLIDKDEQYFENYKVLMTSRESLPAGAYTAVAITDLKRKKEEQNKANEYWLLRNESVLNEMYIEDANWVAGKNKMLGIKTLKFNVSENGVNEFILNVEPAGGLLVVEYHGLHYNGLKQIQVGTNKDVLKCIFNNDGSYNYFENITNDFLTRRINRATYDGYCNMTGTCTHWNFEYIFLLPSKYRFKYLYSNVAEDWEGLIESSPVISVDLKAGEQWYFVYDYVSGDIFWPMLLNGEESRALSFELPKKINANRVKPQE